MSFQTKIFLIILIVHLVMGVVSVFFVNNIINEAITIGLNPNMKSNIENLLEATSEEIATRKRLYDYICRDVIGDISSQLDSGDLEEAKRVILRNFSRYTDLYSIFAGDVEIKLMPSEDRENPTFYYSSQNYKGLNLRCKFAVPDIVIDNQKNLLSIISVYDSIANMKKELSRFYLRAYIFLFGISFVTVMILGYIFVGAFLAPIGELKAGIRRIKNNIFDQPITIDSKDEIGELAAELNRLSIELKMARERESYLDRIGTYQEIARRIAHEIKNPLTPIRLVFQEIEARYTGEDRRYKELLSRSKEIVEEEIKSLNRTIDQLREFARMPVSIKEELKADDFIIEVMKANDYFRDKLNVHLKTQAPSAKVEIDRVLLRRVIENLIQNAIEAGATEIEISSQIKGDYYVLRLEDNGSGIDEKIQDVIFEPYFTTKEYGTGLGLSLAKKAILEHRGNIYLDRELKKGTAFIIELPLLSRE